MVKPVYLLHLNHTNPYFFIFRNTTPEIFINKVSLAGTQIFPQTNVSDTVSVPYAFRVNNNNRFEAEQSGQYLFTTNKGTTIDRKLIEPVTFSVDSFNGRIDFAPVYKDTIPSINIKGLKSLTESNDPKIRYFAGKAHYTIRFDIPSDFVSTTDSILLNLGKIDATAEVILNGKMIAEVWQPFHNIPATKLLKKNNVLEVTVATVCRNRFIGDYIQYGNIKSIWTTSPIEMFLNKNSTLKQSGLIGPIKLIKYCKM